MIKVPKRVLVAILLVGFLSLPFIGNLEYAVARPASNEGWIVYRRSEEDEAGNGIWVMDANGENQEQLSAGGHWRPKWSPNGKRIVFIEIVRSTGKGIYIMDADGSNMKQLTNDPTDDWPDWSPDGKQIAFHRSGDIYVMDTHGANLRKLVEGTDMAGPAADPVWSADGTKIVFDVDFPDRRQIWVVDSDGGNPPKMIQGRGYWPVWSPDGKRIAFTRGTSARRSIWVMDADGANAKKLTSPGDWSAWSPDGTRIAFNSERGGNWDLYVMDADGTNVRQLTSIC